MSKKCIECGVELDDDARYCDECGVEQQRKTEEVNSSENKEQDNMSLPKGKKMTSTYKDTFGDMMLDVLCGIFSVFKYIIGAIIVYLIIGLATGNLKEWNEKAIYYVRVAIHYVDNINFSPKYEEGTPECVIHEYIQALYDGDEYTALKQIDSSNEELKTMTENVVEILQQLEMTKEFEYLCNDMKQAEYTIERDNGNQFIITIQTCDYQSIVAANLDKYGYDVIEKAVKESRKKFKKEAIVQMREINGQWCIVDFEDTQIFLDALTGNLLGSYYSTEE